ncbi:glycosyltransferase [Chroococcidiopsis sp. CCALA 051]|uniref:glycosyltransferase n=1 Tax=Chroococcidiopsis sp. CCALA 051 TaxID=869949 RepID=UPI001E4E9F63|nr:glycosyltransferase [Chroococcidiopsis sp. CCALA 051]
MIKKRNLMLFDLSIFGHHAAYIKYLIQYWGDRQLADRLDVVVSPMFLEKHAEVVGLVAEYNQNNIQIVAISAAEDAALKSRNSKLKRAWRNFQEWQILCRYAKSLNASECLIMYLDTCQIPLALGFKSPCKLSGIYFKPTFHYSDFSSYVPYRKSFLQQHWEKTVIARMLKHPQLKTLFCLDPFVIKHLDRLNSHVAAVHLPDPVQVDRHVSEIIQPDLLKTKLSINANRQIFLLFGSFEAERKGVYQTLEAISQLPSNLSAQICLLIVGNAYPPEQAAIQSQIERVQQSHPVQILTRFEYISEDTVQAYFQLADVVLAPYQRHIGMSGILLLAAAVQKPVLSSNYGLMGEMVKRYRLGLGVDSAIPSEIAQGLTRFLTDATSLGDRNSMKQFAEQNTAEEYAKVIFQYV